MLFKKQAIERLVGQIFTKSILESDVMCSTVDQMIMVLWRISSQVECTYSFR